MKRESIKKKSKDIFPKTAKVLRMSETLFNSIIDQSPYPMWISDEKGTLVRINKSLLDLLCMTEEEVLGKYNIFKDNIVAEQGHLPLVKRVFELGEVVRFEIKYDTSKLKQLQLARHAFVILNVTIFPVKNAKGKITNAVFQHIDITAQKQAEEDLKKNAEQYRIITGTSMDGFSITDTDGHITDVNDAFCRMIGYSRDELLKMSIRDLERKETPPEIAVHIQKIIKEGSGIFQSSLRRKDGQVIDVEISTAFSGQLNQFLIFIRDITERRQAEEVLRESEEKLRTIMETTDEWIWDIDLNGRHTYSNLAIESILGYSLEEIVGGNAFNLMHDADKEKIEKIFATCVEEKKGWHNLVIRWKHKDGTYRYLESNSIPILNQWGELIGFSGADRDITERKLAEEALLRTNERIRIMLETSPLAIFDLDTNGCIQSIWNPAAERLFGWTREEALGRFSLMVPEEKQEEFQKIHKQVNSGQPITGMDIRRKRKDGSPIDCSLYASPLYDSQGRVIGGIAIIADITERKKAETAMQRAKDYAENLIRTANAIVIGLDGGGNINVFNKKAEEITGYNVADLENKSWFDTLVPVDRFPYVRKEFERLMSGGASEEFENPILTKSGQERYIVWRNSTIKENGLVIGTISFGIDVTERKRAEEALQASEERFKHLLESVTDDIYTVKMMPEGPPVSSTGIKCLSITGYTPEEYASDPNLWMKIMHKDDREAFEDLLNKIIAGETGLSLEYRLIHKNGSIRWVRNTPVSRFEGGRLVGYDGLMTDITDRKQAEEALRISEERFKRLVESVTDYIYTVKIENGRPVSSSHGPGCITVTGYTPEEYEAEPYLWYRMIHDEDKQSVQEQTERILSGQEVLPLEHRIIHKNGSIRWVRNKLVPRFIKGRLAAYDGLISDITERKKSEESLRISEEKYRDIFERAMEGIFQTTPEGRFMNVNPSFVSMLGYESPQELIANITDIKKQLYVNPEDRIVFIETIKKHDLISGFEHQVYKKDGTTCWMSVNARAIKDQDGKLICYEGTAEDITIRKKAEEERERLQSQLQQAQKMEAIGTFTGGVAHDFNNILSVFMGYATLLQMEIEQDNPLRIYADQLVSSAKKAATLTQSLLAFSRKQPVNLKPLKLNEHIRGTEKLLKRLLTEDIVLKENLSIDEITIMGDSIQIDQILFNLATNARDAMPKGGILSIETRLVKLDTDFMHFFEERNPGTYALLSFSDTGIGIDKKIKDQIFDPFFTTKEVGKGTGLGLSTVYGIVKQHGGFINVYSEQNKGTTFHIYFPDAPAAVEEEKPATVLASHGKERIIVAEDNESLRLLIKKVLTKYGYIIIEAVDGQDAIAKFKKNKNIDLMILDSVMPKKNGREVYDEIKKINPDIKVLFTSGYTRDIVLDKGIEEKEVEFISKPITPNELLKKVRDVLDRE